MSSASLDEKTFEKEAYYRDCEGEIKKRGLSSVYEVVCKAKDETDEDLMEKYEELMEEYEKCSKAIPIYKKEIEDRGLE